MELTNENYHSTEASMEYMGFSQFKDFCECEYGAMQKILHKEEEKSDALLNGSYLDAYFSGEFEDFTRNHPELYTKQGTLKAAYLSAERGIETINNDPMMLKYWGGQHQVIMIGKIADVPFKIKIDSYFPGKAIVDGKLMKDFEPVWVNKQGRNTKVTFVEAYRYDLEGAIYQEIESQNSETHAKLPFILDAVTKEEYPNKALLSIDQDDLDKALDEVKQKVTRFAEIKKGNIEPMRCGKCKWCRMANKVTGIKSFHILDDSLDEDDLI